MKKKQGFEIRRIGNEDLIVASGMENIEFSNIISMNASSAYLWKQIGENEFDENSVAALLLQKYDVDEATAKADAADIINQWLKAGIIE